MISMAKIELTENEIQAAVEVLRSGALRQGKKCRDFEEAFAEKTEAQHAVTCANGTAALHMAYLTFLEPGDEVLVPSFTFIATASMVVMAGGKPVFCDIDPDTFLMDIDDARSRVTPKTKAIAPVHLFGNPCDAKAFTAFAKKHDLAIVWDAAQAHGAKTQGKGIGAFDDFVCYSFYPSKNMFVGEGGMVTTNDEKKAEKLALLRSHGESGRYCHTSIGLNYRMTDVEAAIGHEQLKRLDEMLAVRRRNAEQLKKELASVPGIIPQKTTPGGIHAWHQFCVLVDETKCGMQRDALAERLNEKGIATGVHYPLGLHQQPVMEEMYGISDLPNTRHLAQNILALPVHHGLTVNQVSQITDAVKEVCHGA